MPLDRMDKLSVFGSLGGLTEALRSFADLGASSSSSLLKVRSTSWPAGLFLLALSDGNAPDEEIECSLDEVGGVRSRSGSQATSLFTEASRDASVISTSSSSPSLLLRPLEVVGGERAFAVA